jgi:HTH-type transcriptional regulator/antitoxin HigA
VRPIRTDDDLVLALETIRALRRAAPGTPEEDQLDVLSTLVHEYEHRHHPIEPPTALEAVKFRLDQGSLTKDDLIRIVGTKSRLSELLSGKRQLSLRARKELYTKHGVPAVSLLQDLKVPRVATRHRRKLATERR